MAKTQTTFFCKSCGASSAKWIGKCPSCGEWNTYVEEVVHKEKTDFKKTWKQTDRSAPVLKPVLLKEVEQGNEQRYPVKDIELARVLGGGIVPGSVILIGGEPGIGKSTLMLQIALQFTDKKVLYISGEESDTQIKMRAERLPSEMISVICLLKSQPSVLAKPCRNCSRILLSLILFKRCKVS